MTPFTPTTAEAPADRPSTKEWFELLGAVNRFKLEEINQRSILGASIHEGFRKDPMGTITMIRQLYPDCPEVMADVIGYSNVKITIP